jgi:CHAT domain-containing protein
MPGSDQEMEKSFLVSTDSYYHDLAKLLIDEGRLPEAQQVLELLKTQEYSDYIRGDPPNLTGPLSLTPAEIRAQNEYHASTAMLISVSEQWSQLRKIASRTPQQEQQFQQLSDSLTKANQALNDYYARLYKLFGSGAEANKQIADIQGSAAALRQQIARMPHTVALYTVVTNERYSVLVITGAAMVAREYPIAEKDLNQKVAAFQQTLRDPNSDPRPLAQDLYKILIAPIQADLDQAHARTLVWSLDGVLRYIPMSALYDGKHYLVEKFGLVSITPASIAGLADQPRMDSVRAVAMGISHQYEQDLQPLPAVVVELDDIVRDPQVEGAHGVLPGSILLNGQFTEKAMEAQLDGRHSIVHIASHFVFRPGDDSNSWLLLAGKDADTSGYHLTVADFRDNPNLRLDDTALLTLSACETGVGGNADNGREVDGLAMTAQLKGAQAVLSSLWEVNDASTGELMADFYKRWADGAGKVTKLEALRQAQLDMLRGKFDGNGPASGRGIGVVDDGHQAPAGFTHPYYWAPFVLMGNWK